MILVATIEHSGTFSLLRLLGYPKRAVCAIELREAAREADILFAHLYDSRIEEILALAMRHCTVTTDRPLAAITASWRARGRDLDELARQRANYERLLRLDPYLVRLGRA